MASGWSPKESFLNTIVNSEGREVARGHSPKESPNHGGVNNSLRRLRHATTHAALRFAIDVRVGIVQLYQAPLPFAIGVWVGNGGQLPLI